MMYLLIVLITLVLALSVGLAVRAPQRSPRPKEGELPMVSSYEEARRLAKGLMKQMTWREKLSQLHGDISRSRFVMKYLFGLLTRFGLPPFYAGANERLGIPPLCFADGPRGVACGKQATAFPCTMARGASFDPELERAVGEAMGREFRAAGINYAAAVCVNNLHHPGWGRAQETYGEDPHHLAEMGLALTQGIQAHGVMACVKHFALNSIECSRFYVDVHIDERTLREIYLPPFRRIVQEGDVASVMSAYNQIRGAYCGHSRHLLRNILRREWNFRGFVTSDWVHGIRSGRKALRAGMDVEMPFAHRYGKPLRRSLKNGAAKRKHVERSVLRILTTRLLYALRPDKHSYSPDLLAASDHVALAKRVALESAVLLKNDGVLPLDKEKIRRLAVIGPHAELEITGDQGSSKVRAPYVITPAEGFRRYLAAYPIEVLVDDGRDMDRAVELARSADAVVVCVGFTEDEEGEYFVMDPNQRTPVWRPAFFGGGGDREELDLPAEHVELLVRLAQANPTTVGVLVVGGAVETTLWRDDVPALIMPFYSGMEGGAALAELVFGASNPSGKLPFTQPDYDHQFPDLDAFAEVADYSIPHGYWRLRKMNECVAHGFGYGLSYTTFALSDLVLERTELEPDGVIDMSVQLANTGSRSGAEVVQLYLRYTDVPTSRRPLTLVAFKKVFLEAGASIQVHLQLKADDCRYYDEDRGWVFESGEAQLLLGRHAQDSKALVAQVELIESVGQ